MKKIVAILLVLVMIVSMAACKKTPTDVVDSDPSTWPVLKMDIAPAADMHNQKAVQDKVNEYLVSIKAGFQVEFVFIEFSARGTVLPTMLTDKTNPIDLFTSRWYSTVPACVNSDQCISLEPYRDKYPEMFKLFPEQVYKVMQINGTQYALPSADSFGGFLVYVMRKDIVDQIGYADYADKEITFEQLKDMLAKAEALKPDMCWVNSMEQTKLMQIDNLGDDNMLGVLKNFGVGQSEIINWYATPEWADYIKACKDFADKGYYIDDPVNTFVIPGDAINNGLMGGYFNEVYSLEGCHAQLKNLNPGLELYVFKLSDSYCSNQNVGSGWMISSISKYPDQAAKLLNLLYTDKKLATLMGCGIENVTYVVDENGCARFADGVDATNAGWHCTAHWFYPNQTLCPPINTDYADFYNDMIKFWANKDKKFSDAMGFTFDSSKVGDQYKACTAIVAQYKKNLLFGQLDVEETNKKFNQELKDAGIDAVIAEMNAQYKAFLGK